MGPFSLGAKLKVNCGAAIVTKVRLQIKALRKQFRGSFAPDPSDPGSNPAGTTAHGVFKGKNCFLSEFPFGWQLSFVPCLQLNLYGEIIFRTKRFYICKRSPCGREGVESNY